MEPLRWILLLIGAVLIGAIYWFGRRHERGERSEGLFERARRAARREEPRADPGDTRAGPIEPDLDISDLDAHGFDVEARPGTAARPASGPGHDAAVGEPRTAGGARGHAESASDEPGAAEPGPADPGAAAPADERPAPAESGPGTPPPNSRPSTEAADTGEPPPVVERPGAATGGDRPSGRTAAGPPGAADEGGAPEAGHEAPRESGRETADRDERGGQDSACADDRAGRSAPDVGERVVVLHVVALSGERLVGSRLRDALERNGLRHGEFDIFHASDSEGSTVFSAANAVEPGTFDRTTMDTLTTPGIALFMQVPGPQSAETVFDRMLSTARSVADELDARVLDESRSTLTRQTEQHLREELRLLDRTGRMGQHGNR